MNPPRILIIRPEYEAMAIREAAAILREGHLLLVPTDTVYGVAADPRVPGAERRLHDAKGRDRDKPVPLLAADRAAVERAGGRFGEVENRLAAAFWPGPLTLVLPAETGDEGFRVPDHDVMRRLLQEIGGVLRVTSANVSGAPPALTADEALRALGTSVAGVLDAGPAPGGIPSTVVSVAAGKVLILRAGAISEAKIAEIAGGA